MKKKFSKILGVGLTLALLVSLLLTAAPVSALTQPSVTLSNDDINTVANYTIVFTIDEGLDEGDEIIIEFDDDIDITDITDAADDAADDVTVEASAGFGTVAGGPTLAASTTDDQELTITIPEINEPEDAIGRIARVTVVVSGIINPDAAGDYYLTVETTEEDAVTSGAITIALPTIVEVPGTVRWYMDGTPMGIDSGATPITAAIAAVGEGYTIEIEPGTYDEDLTTADADVTFVATGTAAETIIEGDWTIDEDDITLDGLTLDGDIVVTADDFTITDCVVDDGGTLDINGGATDATITDTTFNVEDTDAGIEVDADDTTITGATFNVEEDGVGISVEDGGTDTVVEDSTFTGSSGVGINVTNAASVLSVEGNTFDGLEIALDIDAGTVSVKFNSILDSEDVGVDAEVDVDATFNWWGTAVADDIDDMVEGDVEYEPFLTGTADAVLSVRDYVLTDTDLDARDTVGVYVVDTETEADVIVLAKYTANPQEAIANAVAFFDVYVVGTTSADDEVSLRFYAGGENSELYVWSRDTDAWVEAEDVAVNGVGFSTYGGYIYVIVDADLLERTPFVVVTPPAVAAVLAAPTIIMPEAGAVDVSITPTFDWEPVAGADGYYFELADNANFVGPLVQLDGELGRLIATAYTHRTELDYATAYHWRVKAVSGSYTDILKKGVVIGGYFDVEGAWVENVFITMDEPVEPVEPVEPADIILEPADIILEPADIIVTLPPVTPITPAWIYVIIGVGAVLVIALLILIVRTRRVA